MSQGMWLASTSQKCLSTASQQGPGDLSLTRETILPTTCMSKKTDLAFDLQKETQLWEHLGLSLVWLCWTCDLQECKIIRFCCLEHESYGTLLPWPIGDLHTGLPWPDPHLQNSDNTIFLSFWVQNEMLHEAELGKAVVCKQDTIRFRTSWCGSFRGDFVGADVPLHLIVSNVWKCNTVEEINYFKFCFGTLTLSNMISKP